MKRVRISYAQVPCGVLEEVTPQKHYRFIYDGDYAGPAVSLTMPTSQKAYDFEDFPPFFDGLLPEGLQLEAMVRSHKIDQHDYMSQLLLVGGDLVGVVTIQKMGEGRR